METPAPVAPPPKESTPTKVNTKKPSGKFDFNFGAKTEAPKPSAGNPFQFKFNPSTPEPQKPAEPEVVTGNAENVENGDPQFEPIIHLEEVEGTVFKNFHFFSFKNFDFLITCKFFPFFEFGSFEVSFFLIFLFFEVFFRNFFFQKAYLLNYFYFRQVLKKIRGMVTKIVRRKYQI